jgi:hypothetical protein
LPIDPKTDGHPREGGTPKIQNARGIAFSLYLKREKFGGADRDRTDDLLIANEALSQLSYSPTDGSV